MTPSLGRPHQACGIIGLEGARPGRPAHGTLADAPTGGLFRLPA